METTNKITFWPLNRVVHFVFFSFVDFPNNLKFLKGNSFLLQKIIFVNFLKLLVENVILTKTPFLGANCLVGLEIGGKI
jgi:hypothetical protein